MDKSIAEEVKQALDSPGGGHILQFIAGVREKYIDEACKFRAEEKKMKRLAAVEAINDIMRGIRKMANLAEVKQSYPDLED